MPIKKLSAQLSLEKVSGGAKEYIGIQIFDKNSDTRFVDLQISLHDMMQALTGLGRVNCNMEVRELQNVGKLKQTLLVEFPVDGFRDKASAYRQLAITCPQGWEFDSSSSLFNSQDSFFKKEQASDQYWARAWVYRYVDTQEVQGE